MGDPDQLLTTFDASKILGVSVESVRIYSNKGLLPAMKTPSGKRLFKRGDVEQLKKERKKNPPPTGRPPTPPGEQRLPKKVSKKKKKKGKA